MGAGQRCAGPPSASTKSGSLHTPGRQSPWLGSPSARGEREDLLEPEELSSAHLCMCRPACGTVQVPATLSCSEVPASKASASSY